jgi:hypothetical protein
MHLQLHTDRMPRNRTILEFEFSDTTRDDARFWIVVTDRKADVCIQPPRRGGGPAHHRGHALLRRSLARHPLFAGRDRGPADPRRRAQTPLPRFSEPAERKLPRRLRSGKARPGTNPQPPGPGAGKRASERAVGSGTLTVSTLPRQHPFDAHSSRKANVRRAPPSRRCTSRENGFCKRIPIKTRPSRYTHEARTILGSKAGRDLTSSPGASRPSPSGGQEPIQVKAWSTNRINSKPPNISYTREYSGVYVEHETRFELAFPSRSSTSHTRRSLIARVSPFRWKRVAIVELIDVHRFTRA